jgi:hypothetical protein
MNASAMQPQELLLFTASLAKVHRIGRRLNFNLPVSLPAVEYHDGQKKPHFISVPFMRLLSVTQGYEYGQGQHH